MLVWPYYQPMSLPKLLLTNDDGIDSVGLHLLAQAMREVGEVVVVAPDTEYSGASASVGPLHLGGTRAKQAKVEGVESAWTINGPPGLCVFYARMGAFGFVPDLVVSGINPGANSGRAVYHSGTVGAALTARNGGIPGLAVSQSFAEPEPGEAAAPTSDGERRARYHARIERQQWHSAAAIAVEVAYAMLEDPPLDCGVLNLNVPNLPVDELKGFRWASVGTKPNFAAHTARLVPSEEDPENTYRIVADWGPALAQPERTDSAALAEGHVALSWLSRITAVDQPSPTIDSRLQSAIPDGSFAASASLESKAKAS